LLLRKVAVRRRRDAKSRVATAGHSTRPDRLTLRIRLRFLADIPPAQPACRHPTLKVGSLRTAIQKEKDTISYYVSLKEFVPGHHNVQVVKAIIREEERHVKILMESLEQTLQLSRQT
jgi:hypothetical protein